MKRISKILKITLLIIVISFISFIQAEKWIECSRGDCAGKSGCDAKKFVHSSCKITCYDDEVLQCDYEDGSNDG